jgi:hypothetical protein
MGTRNLTCVVLDGAFKVAQYGQWDGYPSGQGKTALEFLRTVAKHDGWAEFGDKVRALRVFTNEEAQSIWDAGGLAKQCLSRDCGAGILAHILAGHTDGVTLQTAFARDSLFCEWAYVIDLDKRTFEVYRGFSKEPLDPSERFYGEGKDDGKGYYPVRLSKSYSLDDLPTVDRVCKECDPPDAEDEDGDEPTA